MGRHTPQSVANDFSFHPATDITGELHDAIRRKFQETAFFVLEIVPDGDARDNCLDRLRESMMWANGGIACDVSGSLVNDQPTQ